MSDRTLTLALTGLLLIPATLAGQDWRELTSFRQRGDEERLLVHVRYGAGELGIRPGGSGELYRAAIRYDSELFDPVASYEDGRLEVGVEGNGNGIRMKNNEAGELRLALSPDVPLELDLDFGAVEADLDLTGLRVASLDVETGASDTELRFSEPNPVSCDRLEISLGAAELNAEGLGNANCSRVTVEGGVGDVTLDFSGQWRQDVRAKVTMALGSATLIIPEDVGVSVDKKTFLTGFDRSGFEQRGSVYYSDNWDTASRRLTVDLEGAFGSVALRWARRTGS